MSLGKRLVAFDGHNLVEKRRAFVIQELVVALHLLIVVVLMALKVLRGGKETTACLGGHSLLVLEEHFPHKSFLVKHHLFLSERGGGVSVDLIGVKI